MATKRVLSDKQRASIERRKENGFYKMIGKVGGDRNKAIQLAKDPEYFSNLGIMGGNTLLAQRGRKFFSKIGKIHRTHGHNNFLGGATQ